MTTTNNEFVQGISENFNSYFPNSSGVLTEHDFAHSLVNRPFSSSKPIEILNVLLNPNVDDDAMAIFAMIIAFEHGFEKLSLKASENEMAYS